MRRCLMLTVSLMLAVIITACGGATTNDIHEYEEYSHTYEDTYNAEDYESTEHDTAQETREEAIARLIAEDREDLEYFAEILRDNFPRFNSINRQLDIDLNQRLDAMYNNLGRRANPGQRFLEMEFTGLQRRLQGSGHLFPVNEFGYLYHLTSLYRERYEAGADFVPSGIWQYYYDSLRSERAIQRFGNVEVDLDAPLSNVVANNITTEIIEEGHIARMRIAQLPSWNMEQDREIVLAFYQEIADFDHLIIDLRGNPGGATAFFTEIIMAPLLSEPARGRYYEFITVGEQAMFLAEASREALHIPFESTDGPIPIAGFMLGVEMTEFAMEDLDSLDYVLIRNFIVMPENTVGFDGKVWVLTDAATFSGAATSAMIAKYSGFATLVGNPTGSVFSGMSVYRPLPNSGSIIRFDAGYVTNGEGRQLQERGIMPHYPNRSGLDALGTVLEMIK